MNTNVDLTETRGPLLWRLGIAMTILPTLAIIFRFWSRIITTSRTKLWWDDWLALCAWCCCICNCAFTIYTVKLGLGKHFEAFTSEADVTELLKIFYVSQIVFDSGLAFAKFSVLCFYYRVFSSRTKGFKVAHNITFGLVAVFIIYKLPAQIFSCVPPSKNWHPEMAGHCENDYTNFGLLLAGLLLDVITDLMILLLPMPIIYRLQINRGRMLALFAAFATGYITWITSLGRMAAFISIKPHLGDPDISWYQIPQLSWSLAEISVSVLSICIPSWFYLFKRVARGGVSSLFSTRDLSISPGKVLRGGSQNQKDVGYRLASSNSNFARSDLDQDNISATEAPLIRLQRVHTEQNNRTNPAAPLEREPGTIRVKNDVILSYQNGEHDGIKEFVQRREWV